MPTISILSPLTLIPTTNHPIVPDPEHMCASSYPYTNHYFGFDPSPAQMWRKMVKWEAEMAHKIEETAYRDGRRDLPSCMSYTPPYIYPLLSYTPSCVSAGVTCPPPPRNSVTLQPCKPLAL